MTSPERQSGHCWQCDQHLWDVGTDQASWSGKRVGLLLIDGSHMDLTMCDECATAPDFDQLWWRVLGSWADVPKYAAEQLGRNAILGVIYALPWGVVDRVVGRLKDG